MDGKKAKSAQKKSYKKPKLHSEKVMGFGAKCNGVAGGPGDKKTVAGAPDFCNTSRLLS